MKPPNQTLSKSWRLICFAAGAACLVLAFNAGNDAASMVGLGGAFVAFALTNVPFVIGKLRQINAS